MGAVLGEQEIIDVLLANGADPDLMDPDRKTALYWALLRGHRQIAETLLKKGGNPDLLPIPLCRFSFDPVLSACVQSE
jgi:ankyrin repeat protein